MRRNVLLEKSYRFALGIVALSRRLVQTGEFVLAKQVLTAGTSVGAQAEEAQGAQSRADFIAKLFIALKEARETNYWLRILRDSDLLQDEEKILIARSTELIALLTRILKTTRNGRDA